MNQGEDTNVQSLSRLLHTVLYDSSGWIRSNRWNIPAFLCSFGGQNEKKMSVDPGHFPIILFYLICSSKMICTLTEWKYFPKTSSDGPFIAPFTWRPAHAAYCASMLACSTAAVYGKLIYVADIWIVPSRTAGITQLAQCWSVAQLSLKWPHD